MHLTRWAAALQRRAAAWMGHAPTERLPQEFTARAQLQFISSAKEGGFGGDIANSYPGMHLDRLHRIQEQALLIPCREWQDLLRNAPPDSSALVDAKRALETVRVRLAEAPGLLAKVPATTQQLLDRWNDRDNPDHSIKFRQLMDSASTIHIQRAISQEAAGNRDIRTQLLSQNLSFKQPGSSDVVTSVPSSPTMFLTNSEWGAFVTMRLSVFAPAGVPVEMADQRCLCGKEHVSINHALTCKTIGGDVAKHNGTRDFLIYMLRGILQCHVVREPRTNPDAPEVGVDLSLRLNTTHAQADVTLVSLCRKDMPTATTTAALYGATAAEARKRNHYAGMFNHDNMHLYTLAVEVPTFAIGKEFQTFLSMVQSHADNNGIQAAFTAGNYQMRLVSVYIRRRLMIETARLVAKGVQQMVMKNARRTGLPLTHL